MKLHRLTRTYLLQKAGIDPAKAPAQGGGSLKWTPVMILPVSNQPDKSHLIRSIAANVDDGKKRASFLQMTDALFRAITLDDFSNYFNERVVEYKVAHSFQYKNKTESLRELKRGKKDRIYIYPHNGHCGKFIFVFQALHKDQQNTPDEVKRYAESTIKQILDATVMGPIG